MSAAQNLIINKPNNEFVDIDLNATKKKKIRFDGDDSRVVEINTSDVGFISRLSEAYNRLQELENEFILFTDTISDEDEGISDESNLTSVKRFKELDNKMRELIDYIFDAPVSQAAAPSGSMFDPFNGSMRFEYIIELVSAQFEQTLDEENRKMEEKIKKHTAKYTDNK